MLETIEIKININLPNFYPWCDLYKISSDSVCVLRFTTNTKQNTRK